MLKIRALRIHYDPETDSYDYTLYDRYGTFIKEIDYPIQIFDLPKVRRFGFCPVGTVDVTLEFEEGIKPSQIKRNRD